MAAFMLALALAACGAEVNEVVLSGAKAEAKTSASIKSGSLNYSNDVVIKCKKTGGNRYITGIKPEREKK